MRTSGAARPTFSGTAGPDPAIPHASEGARRLELRQGQRLRAARGAALAAIQNELFHLGSDLCILEDDKAKRPVPGIESRHVDALEALMDRLSEELPPLENFVLPGGCPSAAALHVARTVCRRAERLVIALSRKEAVGPFTIRYLNRLSDALFVMARHENRRRGVPDVLWNSRA